MEFQDQTILHGEGRVGDCFRACIATVIGKRTEGVPHFVLLGDLHWLDAAVAWLAMFGYKVDTHDDGWLDDGLEVMPFHIMRGVGPRGIRHAVVGDTATGEMVHDPHPSRGGLVQVESRLYFFRKPKDARHAT